MATLGDTRLLFLDVETTGLSPAMGDRVVELGLIHANGPTEIRRESRLINPARPIPHEAQCVHGITDADVTDQSRFGEVAEHLGVLLASSWIVGHNVRFDIGFLAMELHRGGREEVPLGCLDTCQLVAALWELPNYRLETIVRALEIPTTRFHRALDDAAATRLVFSRAVEALGGWQAVTVDDLLRLHRFTPTWPKHPNGSLPQQLYDALTNGQSIAIQYMNGMGLDSERLIRPEVCFSAGKHTYIRAFCTHSQEIRTFRVDRIRCLGKQPLVPFQSEVGSK